jgi:hypothetical protein
MKPISPDPGLYRVTYRTLEGHQMTMTARPGGAYKDHKNRWRPLWEMDPSDQLGIHPGPIGEIISYERTSE